MNEQQRENSPRAGTPRQSPRVITDPSLQVMSNRPREQDNLADRASVPCSWEFPKAITYCFLLELLHRSDSASSGALLARAH